MQIWVKVCEYCMVVGYYGYQGEGFDLFCGREWYYLVVVCCLGYWQFDLFLMEFDYYSWGWEYVGWWWVLGLLGLELVVFGDMDEVFLGVVFGGVDFYGFVQRMEVDFVVCFGVWVDVGLEVFGCGKVYFDYCRGLVVVVEG